MTIDEACTISADWHSGQWSPFYSFQSTGGEFHFPLVDYEAELRECLKSANNPLHKQEDQVPLLEELLAYFR